MSCADGLKNFKLRRREQTDKIRKISWEGWEGGNDPPFLSFSYFDRSINAGTAMRNSVKTDKQEAKRRAPVYVVFVGAGGYVQTAFSLEKHSIRTKASQIFGLSGATQRHTCRVEILVDILATR